MKTPTPTGRTRLGFHYFDDSRHYRALDLQTWLPELHALGAGWLTLRAALSRAVPEPFVTGLIEAGIQPIIHIPARPIQRLDLAALRPLLATYARWGVSYVSIFDRPNTRAAWTPADWTRPQLLDRFLDIFTPIALAQQDAGLQPVFPPLEPGGDYWDTAFLEAALDRLVSYGLSDLADSLTFAFYAPAFNRPPDWGAGGPQRWPLARPYLTPPDSQDNRGFHTFDWISALVREKIRASRPLLCLAGGVVPGDQTDPDLPPVDSNRHTAGNKQIAEMVFSGQLPTGVLNVNFWLLAADPAGPASTQAWYQADGGTLPIVAEVKRLAKAHGAAEEAWSGKPIYHYVLLPDFEWGASSWHLEAVREYVRAFRPALGFSPQDAAHAKHVTIVGNEQGISKAVARSLQQQGCRVERISGPNGEAIVRRLEKLVQRGQRFADDSQ